MKITCLGVFVIGASISIESSGRAKSIPAILKGKDVLVEYAQLLPLIHVPRAEEIPLLKAASQELGIYNVHNAEERARHKLLMASVRKVEYLRFSQSPTPASLTERLQSCRSIAPDQAKWTEACQGTFFEDEILQRSWDTLPAEEANVTGWLVVAAQRGPINTFKFLWSQRTTPQEPPLNAYEIRHLTQEAAAHVSISILRFLQARHLETFPEAQGELLDAAIYASALHGQLTILQSLEGRVTDQQKRAKVLGVACENGNVEMVKYLQARQITMPMVMLEGALLGAASHGNLEILKYFLWDPVTNSPKPPRRTSKDFYARMLTMAASYGRQTIVEFLLQRRDNNTLLWPLEDYGEAMNTALAAAMQWGQKQLVRCLLTTQEDGLIKYRDYAIGSNVLISAARTGRFDMITILASLWLQRDARSQLLDFAHSENLPLRLACRHGDAKLVRLYEVLKREGGITAIDAAAHDYDALVQAFANGHEHVYKYLLEQSNSLLSAADAGEKTAAMERALIAACKQDQLASVKYLVERNLVQVNARKNAALTLAAVRGHEAIVVLLLSHRAQVSLEMVSAVAHAGRDALLAHLLAQLPSDEYEDHLEEMSLWRSSLVEVLGGQRYGWTKIPHDETSRRKEVLKTFFRARYGEVPDEATFDEMVQTIGDARFDLRATLAKLQSIPALCRWDKAIVQQWTRPTVLLGTTLAVVMAAALFAYLAPLTVDVDLNSDANANQPTNTGPESNMTTFEHVEDALKLDHRDWGLSHQASNVSQQALKDSQEPILFGSQAKRLSQPSALEGDRQIAVDPLQFSALEMAQPNTPYPYPFPARPCTEPSSAVALWQPSQTIQFDYEDAYRTLHRANEDWSPLVQPRDASLDLYGLVTLSAAASNVDPCPAIISTVSTLADLQVEPRLLDVQTVEVGQPGIPDAVHVQKTDPDSGLQAAVGPEACPRTPWETDLTVVDAPVPATGEDTPLAPPLEESTEIKKPMDATTSPGFSLTEAYNGNKSAVGAMAAFLLLGGTVVQKTLESLKSCIFWPPRSSSLPDSKALDLAGPPGKAPPFNVTETIWSDPDAVEDLLADFKSSYGHILTSHDPIPPLATFLQQLSLAYRNYDAHCQGQPSNPLYSQFKSLRTLGSRLAEVVLISTLQSSQSQAHSFPELLLTLAAFAICASDTCSEATVARPFRWELFAALDKLAELVKHSTALSRRAQELHGIVGEHRIMQLVVKENLVNRILATPRSSSPPDQPQPEPGETNEARARNLARLIDYTISYFRHAEGQVLNGKMPRPIAPGAKDMFRSCLALLKEHEPSAPRTVVFTMAIQIGVLNEWISEVYEAVAMRFSADLRSLSSDHVARCFIPFYGDHETLAAEAVPRLNYKRAFLEAIGKGEIRPFANTMMDKFTLLVYVLGRLGLYQEGPFALTGFLGQSLHAEEKRPEFQKALLAIGPDNAHLAIPMLSSSTTTRSDKHLMLSKMAEYYFLQLVHKGRTLSDLLTLGQFALCGPAGSCSTLQDWIRWDYRLEFLQSFSELLWNTDNSTLMGLYHIKSDLHPPAKPGIIHGKRKSSPSISPGTFLFQFQSFNSIQCLRFSRKISSYLMTALQDPQQDMAPIGSLIQYYLALSAPLAANHSEALRHFAIMRFVVHEYSQRVESLVTAYTRRDSLMLRMCFAALTGKAYEQYYSLPWGILEHDVVRTNYSFKFLAKLRGLARRNLPNSPGNPFRNLDRILLYLQS